MVARLGVMKRRLLDIPSAVSLLLFVAMGVLWVRSYRVTEEIGYRHQNQGATCGVASDYGSIDVVYNNSPPPSYAAGFHYKTGFRSAREGQRLGFKYSYYPGCWLVRFPYWLPMLAAAILPAAWLIRERKKRRQLQHDHCSNCGYDLRASKDRCPECGTPIPAQSQGVQN